MLSGTAVGCFGALVVVLGGWWFTAAVGVIVHLALLEFFRMAQFKGIRPATKTTLVACQLLLFSSQWAVQGGMPEALAAAVLPLAGAAICGWLLLQPVTGSIADIAASVPDETRRIISSPSTRLVISSAIRTSFSVGAP